MKALFVVFALALAACNADGERYMTRHEVCERIAAAACERIAVCEPLVAQAGCTAREMNRCCPDGVCSEAVIATEDRLAACETAVSTASCGDLTDGDLPTSCEDLTDPVPDMPRPDGGMQQPDAGPNVGDGILEVSWSITAGGTSLQCSQFGNADTVRIVATPPGGSAVTRDFSCIDFSALARMPVGVYSVVAQARAGGTIVQQTTAKTVTVSASGSFSEFSFSVTTSFGSFCQQLANAACNACAPSDATCKTELYNECCGTDGTCGRAAIANPQFSTCISDVSSGQFCADTSPPSCAGSVMVF